MASLGHRYQVVFRAEISSIVRLMVEFVLPVLVAQGKKPPNQFGDKLRSTTNGGLI